MNQITILAKNLTKKFGALTALDGLSLEINSGEIFAFLGPNGAGKTTTVKLFAGLLKPTSGSAGVLGFDVALQPVEARKVIGFLSDQPFAYPYLTGFEFLRLSGDLYGVDTAEQCLKIPELLEMFGLTPRAGDLVESYSHGMKQKLALASVLLHKPKVLFLDEPLVGLDPKSARLVKDIIVALAGRGVTVFMCTHVIEIAEKLAHRVGILERGKLIAMESVADLKRRMHTDANLEDMFLQLTGGTEYAELLKYL